MTCQDHKDLMMAYLDATSWMSRSGRPLKSTWLRVPPARRR